MLNKREFLRGFILNELGGNAKSSNLNWKVENSNNTDMGYSKRVLYNYSTIIAIVKDNEPNTLYLNSDKYSVTTTKNQNLLRYFGKLYNFEVIELFESEIMAL